MKKRIFANQTVRLFLTFLCALFMAFPLFSQTTGRIAGTVVDASSGDPLPGANVSIPGTLLGAASGVDGDYVIVNVPVGRYDVQVTMMGYKKLTKTGVLVSIDRTTSLDFNLETEIIEGEEVFVVAERDVLHKETSNSQQVVVAEQIIETAGVRTINEFLGAQAGIGDEATLTVRGGSADQTGTLVNGISFVNPRIGKAEASIPLSAVEQVSLQSGGFSAEYGNYRSGILNVTTKTGDKDAYHGTFTYSRNVPHMKRFGKSMYDPTNNSLLPYMDPILGFKGTATLDSWLEYANGNEEEAEYLMLQYEQVRGWDEVAARYNRSATEEMQATPMDLYLWSAWMHQVVPDFDALEEKYPEYTITEAQKQALRDHAHPEEGENEDYDIDFGFGGPLPFVSNMLGDATFYLSHKSTFYTYVQPVMRDGEKTATTMLTMKSNLTDQLTLKLNGIYRKIEGSQQRMASNGDIPDLENGGGTMPINNLYQYLYMGSQYLYHPTFWQPKDQTTYVGGLTLNYILNSNTFMDLTLSYAHHKDFYDPHETRNPDVLVNFGPFYMNEMPYGIVFGPDTVHYDPSDPSKIYASDTFGIPSGLSIARRFSAKVGEFHENSTTEQYRAKFDLSSQVNKYNFVKTGVELNYFDINNDNYRYWLGFDTIYEMRDRRKPWQFGAYLQDQVSLKGMEARFGVRLDYYNSGGGVWPTGDPYNEDAFTRGTEGDNVAQLQHDLESGKRVVWSRWEAIDEELGGTLLEETKNYLTISPRLGISFPVTETSKFFFNYGHFRSLTPFSQQYMYQMRFYKTGLTNIGNPNLEPPRTISYELGVAYNFLNQYLLELSTYYKDVTGEAAQVSYSNMAGTVSYNSFLNNRWENDQGFEMRITKSVGKYFTGWLNTWFVIDKNGRTGRQTASEDPVQNEEETSLYAGDENTPTIRPRVSANFSFRTPESWGPKVMGQSVLGDWMLSIMPSWERGALFTYNPADIRNLSDNLRWPDYHMVDMKLSKALKIKGVQASVFVDVNNIFNTKVSWMSNGYCFSDGDIRDADVEGTDAENYLSSLHLPMYDSPDYDGLRQQNPGKYIPGDDKVGDLRSEDKPYIDNPDWMMFLYGLPRDIWFGVSFSF